MAICGTGADAGDGCSLRALVHITGSRPAAPAENDHGPDVCPPAVESVAVAAPSAAPLPPKARHRRSTFAQSPSSPKPWAMTFLPDGRLLVTEKKSALKVVTADGKIGNVTGTPTVDYGGQGGFGDVILHPKFADNGWVYLSYAEAGDGDKRGAAVARAKLRARRKRRRPSRRTHGDLAPGTETRRSRPLRPSPAVRRRRASLHQLGRTSAFRSGAGHEVESRQDRASQRRRLAAERQPARRSGRRRGTGVDARSPQSAR